MKVSHGLDLAVPPGFRSSVPISGLCRGRPSAAQEDGRGRTLLSAREQLPVRTSFLVNVHHQERGFLSPFPFCFQKHI